ncbi:sigma-70 family RNA polymerase sigma factor [Kitasatospora sp. NPDC098652]|uniref:sigma-70 family RNA polymerase sigma factor n=1 Tax=Kitasatospora sp. NPDC098652 TaxID=3364095 RepID=UPI0037FCBFAF
MTPRASGPADVAVEQLLMRVAGGDPRAFDQLHDAIGAALFLIVLRVVRDRGHTQDVVQEVLLEIWRKAHHFQPARGTAMAWIATIAHRRAVDRVRTERAAHERDLRAALLERPVPVEDISEQIEHLLALQRVRDGLDALTDLQRQAVVLAYYHDCSHQEIADLLRLPLGTAKSRVRDALLRLRMLLHNDSSGADSDGEGP